MNQAVHIVLAGGGTAGHLFPGLAVAEQLCRVEPKARITLAGAGKAFERSHVTSAGFDYVPLPSRPLPSRPHEALRFVADNLRSYYAAARFLRDHDVSLVVGLGGYASAAMARAAARQRIPLVLLEQNAVPGRTTRWLAPRASLICLALAEARAHLPRGRRVRVTGNPIRTQFVSAYSTAMQSRLEDHGRPRRLLVLGGSGGSKMLNEQVPLALYKAGTALEGWRIIHQTGERNAPATRALYQKLGLRATVGSFINNMAGMLLNCDLAITRAGGTTLAELAACGVPTLLVPFPRAADDHQRKNADVFSSAGAARTLDEREIAGRFDNALAAHVVELVTHSALRLRMAQAMLRLARPTAAAEVATAILAVLHSDRLAKVA